MGDTAWVAGAVRARALAGRCVGVPGARGIAGCPNLAEAVGRLDGTALAGDGTDPQRAVEKSFLWRMRVLAGWLPPSGVGSLRALSAWFEIRNIEEHLRHVSGRDAPAPYRLGALGVAWSRLAGTATPDELRTALSRSGWGDPGGTDAGTVALALRLAWARWVIVAAPEARPWAVAAVAQLVARERWLLGRPLAPPVVPRACTLLGAGALRASSWPGFVAAVPTAARWAFDDLTGPEDLWRAQPRWWRRVERDGERMLHGGRLDRRVVLGAVAVCAADAWRIRAALACAEAGDVAAFDELV